MTLPRRSWRPILTALVTAALVATGLSACAGDATAGADDAPAGARVPLTGEPRTVRVGVLRQPHLSHPLFYAGFAPENVTLDIIPFSTSTEIKNAVVSGDLGFGVTGITSALQGAAAGEPVVVVAAAADGGSAIVAGKDAGIASVADLRGKRIGFVPASAQDILLRLTLTGAGLDPTRDVELVNVGFADMATALARGDIDAFSGAETGPSDALVSSSATLVTHPYDTPMGKLNIALVTSRTTIERDPDLVRAMVAVHARATDHMAGHVDQWVEKIVNEYGFTEASLQKAATNIFLRWRMDDAYLAQIRVLGAQQKALGQIQREPDYATFVDPAFVASA